MRRFKSFILIIEADSLETKREMQTFLDDPDHPIDYEILPGLKLQIWFRSQRQWLDSAFYLDFMN